MPNQRSPGQRLITFAATEQFERELNAAFRKAGYDDRSKFMRAAIGEKVRRAGLPFSYETTLAPNRTNADYQIDREANSPWMMNEKLSSTGTKTAEQGKREVIEKVKKAGRKSARTNKVAPPSGESSE